MFYLIRKSWILLIFLFASWSVNAQTTEEPVKKVDYPADYSARIDAIYVIDGDWQGRVDIYYPTAAKEPVPVVINIHGGGWNHGNKESQTGFKTFFNLGFAVANIAYRLTPQEPAPAAVEDARCAMLYLVKNAKELNIDPHRIVYMGGSAGGHLALLAGLLQNDHRFDTKCPGINGFTIAAIIDKYGITNLNTPEMKKYKSARNWLGMHVDDPEFVKAMSPVSYVTKNSPPVFIVHGDADPLIPYSQSVELHEALETEGVENEFITVEGGKHGKFEKEKNSEINRAIADFLRRTVLNN
jgi:acetyl esterase/lipase